jgi:cobalt-precorrin-7 (C5)-methyltransferase
LGKIYAVGVGPGSSKYVTEITREIIQNCDIVIGYKYTLDTIHELLEGKEIHEITMNNQEESYQKILPVLGERSLVVPFTGDVSGGCIKSPSSFGQI